MGMPNKIVRDERGVAIVMTLIILVALTSLVLAFITVSAYEPQISQNLTDSTQARFLADAGIEWAFDQLASNPSWNNLLGTATACGGWVTPTTPAATTNWSGVTATGLTGSFTVQIRNDCLAADTQITGLSAADTTGAPNAWTRDMNGVLILRATGTGPNSASRTVQVVIRNDISAGAPDWPGAVNMPGMQADTHIYCPASGSCSSFFIDARDNSCATCDGTAATDNNWYNTSNWAQAANAQKFAISVQPGIQANLGSPSTTTYEARVESEFTEGTSSQQTTKQSELIGKHQTTGATTTGLATIAADPAAQPLNPAKMASFLASISSNPKTQILQSTQACPMVLTGGASSSDSTPTLTNGCGLNTTVDLGTPSNPQLVYFRGDPDPSSAFTGLRTNNMIKGAGILIIEDGDLKNYGTLDWQGVVIVTGQYVGSGFMNGSTTRINGAFISNETQGTEVATYYEFYLDQGSNSRFNYSQQALNLLRSVRNFLNVYGWREI